MLYEVITDRIQQAGRERVHFIIINPAAYTHTSTAASASRSAMLVCVRAPALMIMKSTPSPRAAWMRSTSSYNFV